MRDLAGARSLRVDETRLSSATGGALVLSRESSTALGDDFRLLLWMTIGTAAGGGGASHGFGSGFGVIALVWLDAPRVTPHHWA